MGIDPFQIESVQGSLLPQGIRLPVQLLDIDPLLVVNASNLLTSSIVCSVHIVRYFFPNDSDTNMKSLTGRHGQRQNQG